DSRPFVFTQDRGLEYALLVLVLDQDKMEVNGLACGGWQPLGAFHTITKSKGNVVYEIDGIPALDCVAKYGGISLEKARSETGDRTNAIEYFIRTGSLFQLELHREGKSPIMRAATFGSFEEKYLVFGGTVPEGSRVIFSILPGFDTTDNLIREYEKYHEQKPEAEAVILFSCSGRDISIGPWMEEEIVRINNIWKSPMAGFFTYGEIGPDGSGQTDFHNLTCSLLLLSEKPT
ncbi:MAG: FIST C-terminal domain-containing protein, partial [Flavobacteriales bacterium]